MHLMQTKHTKTNTKNIQTGDYKNEIPGSAFLLNELRTLHGWNVADAE